MKLFGIKKHSFDLLWYGISLFFFCFVVTASTGPYCPPPNVPFNGKYEPKRNKYAPGSEVVFYCNRYFTLSRDNATTVCQTNGKWTEITPFCDGWEKSYKIVRAILKPSNISTPSVFDDDIFSCQDICNGCSIQLDLEKEVVVNGYRITKHRGETEIGYGLNNSVNFGGDENSEKLFGVSFYEGDYYGSSKHLWSTNNLTADKVIVRKKFSESKNVSARVCEFSVLGYGRDDSGCAHPPEVTVPNGYFIVSRKEAELICDDGYVRKNDLLLCKNNSWKGLPPRCDKVETASGFQEMTTMMTTNNGGSGSKLDRNTRKIIYLTKPFFKRAYYTGNRYVL